MNQTKEIAYLVGTAIGVLLIYSGWSRSTNNPFTWLVNRSIRFSGSESRGRRLLLWGGLAVALVNGALAFWSAL